MRNILVNIPRGKSTGNMYVQKKFCVKDYINYDQFYLYQTYTFFSLKELSHEFGSGHA